jgi:PAS domain S-box-containing protein
MLLLWGAGIAALAALGTWAALALWARSLRREVREAESTVEARDDMRRRLLLAERQAADALAGSERRHRALTEAGAIIVFQAAPDGRVTAVEGWSAFTGRDPAELIGSAEAWLDAVVREDRARLEAGWKGAVAARRGFDAEFRMRTAAGAARWCRVRAVTVPGPPEAPDAVEWIAVMEDIDARRRAEEARLLLAREVNHRARNMLAVVQAVVRLTRASEPETYAAAVSARIEALGRAHDLLAQRDWGEVRLEELARGELAAWLSPRAGEPARVRLDGPSLPLPAAAVQPMAIALHELATNAAKYGALSNDAGMVDLRWRLVGEEGAALHLAWTETGGPKLQAPPVRNGFGTKVIDASVREQLHGTVQRHWEPGGLRCDITLPYRLSAAAVQQTALAG